MELDEQLRQLADRVPPPPPGDASAVVDRGVRRRRGRRAAGATAVTLGVVAVVALAAALAGGDAQAPEVADHPPGPGRAAIEQAPDAGAVAAHWPIELVFEQSSAQLRFRGESWADWSMERRDGDDWLLIDREHPGDEEFEPEGRAFIDKEDAEEGFVRVPGPHVHRGWRGLTGLYDRVVVELEEIPGGPELVETLGLGPDEVEAYASPTVAGCREPLDDCVPEGGSGARGIAHLPTGFPLFAEEAYAGGPAGVWLEARSIRWGDAAIQPVPAEDIPRMSQRAAADDLVGRPEDEVVGTDDVLVVRRDGEDLEVPADRRIPGRMLLTVEDGVITEVHIEGDPSIPTP